MPRPPNTAALSNNGSARSDVGDTYIPVPGNIDMDSRGAWVESSTWYVYKLRDMLVGG